MEWSEPTTEIVKAIHLVQQSIGVIAQEDEADIAGKYKYKYANMATIWSKLKPILENNDLTIIQSPITGGNVVGDFLETMVVHKTGEYVKSRMRLVARNEDPQAYGAAITYARRYMISSIFGLITGDDNDAQQSKLATGEMKKEWVRAYMIVAKKQNPEGKPTNIDFINFLQEVYGKHPSKIYADENQNVLDTIKAFE